jgi:drug/metabolite transporter (DMT)-like permease
VWYSVLPRLTAWRAALVQLLTPVLTTVAAVVMLGESISWRFLTAGTLIVGGVLISLAAPRRA